MKLIRKSMTPMLEAKTVVSLELVKAGVMIYSLEVNLMSGIRAKGSWIDCRMLR